MHGGKAPTKAEKNRMEAIVLTGCMACRLRDVVLGRVPEVHHLKDCGNRKGHWATICLCDYHHRGVLPDGVTRKMAEQYWGPSFHAVGTYGGSKPFKDAFGTDESLLAMQNELLEMR